MDLYRLGIEADDLVHVRQGQLLPGGSQGNHRRQGRMMPAQRLHTRPQAGRETHASGPRPARRDKSSDDRNLAEEKSDPSVERQRARFFRRRREVRSRSLLGQASPRAPVRRRHPSWSKSRIGSAPLSLFGFVRFNRRAEISQLMHLNCKSLASDAALTARGSPQRGARRRIRGLDVNGSPEKADRTARASRADARCSAHLVDLIRPPTVPALRASIRSGRHRY